MRSLYNPSAPKKSANLSINSDLLMKAREQDINLSATLEQALAERLRQQQRECWLTDNHEAIAAAKAGIIGLTLAAAASYAGNQLRVNAVAPGLTETPLTQSLTANESARKLSEAMHALGRLGQPEDIARAIVFLLDPANSWITGQVLAVDGGLSRVRPRMKA